MKRIFSFNLKIDQNSWNIYFAHLFFKTKSLSWLRLMLNKNDVIWSNCWNDVWALVKTEHQHKLSRNFMIISWNKRLKINCLVTVEKRSKIRSSKWFYRCSKSISVDSGSFGFVHLQLFWFSSSKDSISCELSYSRYKLMLHKKIYKHRQF